MAVTILRLNLDTLARTYALCWADETPGMTAESFASDVMNGKHIRDMKLRGSKSKAQDGWLIDQISGLDTWVKTVYQETSGAIHFSSFHLKQLLKQNTKSTPMPDGSIMLNIVLGGTEYGSKPEDYRRIQQAFCHITSMLLVLIQDRCGLLRRNLEPNGSPELST